MKKGTFPVVLMAGFSAMLGLAIISPFLPVFAEEHGANGFWLGMIFAGFAISRSIIMPVVGKVSDKTGRKIFVTSGLLLYTVISLFYPLARSVYQLTIIRMVHGLAAGMILPIVFAYVGDLAEKGREGFRTGTLNMMFYLGLAAGPFLGGFLNRHFGFDAVFHVMSALGLVTFFVVLLFLPEDKSRYAATGEKSPPFHSLIKYNFIKGILIISIVCTLMMAVFISFVPSLAAEINIDTHHIGIILSVGIFLAGLLQIPSGRFADSLDRIGKLTQIGAGISLGMLALLVMPLCPDFTALLVTGSFVGIGAGVSIPALTSISVHIGHRTGMGAWMGIFTAAMSIGLVITPLVAGVVMDHLGIDSAFYILALLAFFGSLGSLHYIRRRLAGYKQG
jgi:DHA1 family multidrug resistance protein-like MFS transporter